MSGADRGPSSEGGPRRRSRWRDPDWWFGRTPEQRARKEAAWQEFREARADVRDAWRDRPERAAAEATAGPGGALGAIGRIGRVLTIVLTLPIIAAAFFGPVGFVIALILAVVLLRRGPNA